MLQISFQNLLFIGKFFSYTLQCFFRLLLYLFFNTLAFCLGQAIIALRLFTIDTIMQSFGNFLRQAYRHCFFRFSVIANFLIRLQRFYRHFFINFFTEYGIGLVDYSFLRYFNITVFVNRNFLQFFMVQLFFAASLLFDRFHFVQNLDYFFWCVKDNTNVAKEHITHKTTADYFFGFDFQRNCQYLGCVYLLHFTVLIFGKNGKEVQQTLDVCFTLTLCTTASGSSGIKTVGKFVKDHQGALRCKIKDIGVLLLIELAVLFKFKGVLRSECSLNIFRRAFHVAEHENSCPFGNGDACCKLAYA